MPIGASVAPNDRYMQWAGIWRKQVWLGEKWSIVGEKKLNHFLGQVVDLDLLLCSVCTGFDWELAVLILCHILTPRPMTERKIEQSDGRGFCCRWSATTSCQFHRNFHFRFKKILKVARSSPKFILLPDIYKALNLVDSWTESELQEW